ncbi:hypothetical protein PAXINDRAFT_115849 [Paxillus involutus ATCC 200175]|uniref:Uncharacterized protein n=1 Tax=Paxillus involutus ATCC 200175 TaxID=664439 RepID=A0A0C9U5R6_PAXIN|nr:hypothetical protein PAXINDRAFT_115849 [Paxillus involutus ATCC 200175]
MRYQSALQESYAREAQYKTTLLGMQSAVVLQSMYCGHMAEQLAAQEEKQKKRKKGQLNGDGLPRLLTSDDFFGLVVERQKVVEEERVACENQQREKEELSGVMAVWKEVDNARKNRNKACREAYRDELAVWEEERALAKSKKRRIGWKRPKLGKLESPAPRPAVEGAEGVGSGDESDGTDDEGIEADGGSVE